MRPFLPLTLVVLAFSTASFAQVAAPPPPGTPSTEEPPPARIQLGPVGVRPGLIVRDVGYDSNVLNTSTNEQGDFTATVGARVDLDKRVSRVLANYASFYEYLYFQDFADERGSNRGLEGRADFLLGRLRPYVLGAVRTSHDRPSPEIDARAARRQTALGVGAAAAAASHTTVTVGYRREASDYGNDETFRGITLEEELDGRSHALTYATAFELTPLTTLSVHGEERRERFSLSPDRDANSHRYGVTASLNPLALVAGQASIGFAAFRPLNALEPDFTGMTAAIAVTYAIQDASRVGLSVDRDIRHSVFEETPYYIVTGFRGTFTQRLVRNLDGQATAGFDRIAYRARLDAPPTTGNQTDRVKLAGAGVGLRFSPDARLLVNYDYTVRASPVDSRHYSRGRVFATLNYGF